MKEDNYNILSVLDIIINYSVRKINTSKTDELKL